jgi:hypothetical protein
MLQEKVDPFSFFFFFCNFLFIMNLLLLRMNTYSVSYDLHTYYTRVFSTLPF